MELPYLWLSVQLLHEWDARADMTAAGARGYRSSREQFCLRARRVGQLKQSNVAPKGLRLQVVKLRELLW